MERYYDKYGYANGCLERKAGGRYEGTMKIEGVELSPIVGTYFKTNGETFLWLRRRPIIEYDFDRNEYVNKTPRPAWEVYMKKGKERGIAFRGSFIFFHFRFDIVGIWNDPNKLDKLNFFVERAEEQEIINGISRNERL